VVISLLEIQQNHKGSIARNPDGFTDHSWKWGSGVFFSPLMVMYCWGGEEKRIKGSFHLYMACIAR